MQDSFADRHGLLHAERRTHLPALHHATSLAHGHHLGAERGLLSLHIAPVGGARHLRQRTHRIRGVDAHACADLSLHRGQQGLQCGGAPGGLRAFALALCWGPTRALPAVALQHELLQRVQVKIGLHGLHSASRGAANANFHLPASFSCAANRFSLWDAKASHAQRVNAVLGPKVAAA